MSPALKALITGEQHFPAPDIAVGAVTRPIERYADHLIFKVVFRHATGDVCVMMLHSHQLHSLLLKRPLGGEVVGMQVVCEGCRLDFENISQMIDRLNEELEAFRILQVSDMLAQEGVLSFGEANRVLQLAAHREYGRLFVLRHRGTRDIPSRPAQMPNSADCGPHDGVIAAQQNVPVVHQK